MADIRARDLAKRCAQGGECVCAERSASFERKRTSPKEPLRTRGEWELTAGQLWADAACQDAQRTARSRGLRRTLRWKRFAFAHAHRHARQRRRDSRESPPLDMTSYVLCLWLG